MTFNKITSDFFLVLSIILCYIYVLRYLGLHCKFSNKYNLIFINIDNDPIEVETYVLLHVYYVFNIYNVYVH